MLPCLLFFFYVLLFWLSFISEKVYDLVQLLYYHYIKFFFIL